jgi:hypothetical protein
MVYDAYDRGISRNNSQDAASRVAGEIFQHDLQQASTDTRGAVAGLSGRQAQIFANRVNQDLAELNREYNQSPYGNQNGESQLSNHLATRQIRDSQGNQLVEIDMVSGDRIHHAAVVDVPLQPYGRVPMNFNQYQPGEAPPSSYYGNQSAYSGWQNPGAPPINYDYSGANPNYGYGANNPNYYAPRNPNYYETSNPGYYAANNPNSYNYGNTNYEYPPVNPMPVNYGGGYYHRHVPYGYGYAGGYGYEGYPVNNSIAAGAIIGGALARVFRI